MDIETRTTSSAYHAPKEVSDLAEQLAKVHGCKVIVSMEAQGYHIYIPCPECLKTHGRRELADPKYSINASKYLGIGDRYRKMSMFDRLLSTDTRSSEEKADMGSSICMRTRSDRSPHRFSVNDLLNITSISERHPDILTKASIVGQAHGDKESHWEEDPMTGIKGPPLPGETVPIIMLPQDHPCIEYILERGFKPMDLYRQFGCEFCVKEYPEGQQDIYYKRMPDRWKDSPQNRLIFYAIVDGWRKTWQARLIERVVDNGKTRQMLHPYRRPFAWSDVATRPSREHAWIPKSPFDELDDTGSLKFSPSKYRTAKYSNRGAMGWDAAVKNPYRFGTDFKVCVLCEGPLDAARVGPGGIAVLGSSLSMEGASMIARNFDVVITAFDNDKAGAAATETIKKQLFSQDIPHPVISLVEPMTIPEGKDIGEMNQDAFNKLLASTITRVKRKQ